MVEELRGTDRQTEIDILYLLRAIPDADDETKARYVDIVCRNVNDGMGEELARERALVALGNAGGNTGRE